ncbi:MAG TPA: zinc ribbon domain-containing protein [Acidiferrobacteraceae bacterium]|nr:zinc ribbon domain-containing protein [Acidiferrobacteraceae bacterium]
MPIYEYECDACGHRLEVIQKMNEPPKMDCPECGEAKLKKLLSVAGFRLKGSGWYETDFKNSGSKPKSAKPTETKNSTSTPSTKGGSSTPSKS